MRHLKDMAVLAVNGLILLALLVAVLVLLGGVLTDLEYVGF